jgi:hypothetical protein
MSEVTEFLSYNSHISPALREFAMQYSSLAEVWVNCPNSLWMLRILYDRKYRNFERLERYIEWLREQIQQNDDERMIGQELQQLETFKQWADKQIEEDLQAERITRAEAIYRRFKNACEMAGRVSLYILTEKDTDAKLDNLYERYKGADEGLYVPVVDEAKISIAGLKEQADKLREFVGNPFTPEGAEDFYYGSGQF